MSTVRAGAGQDRRKNCTYCSRVVQSHSKKRKKQRCSDSSCGDEVVRLQGALLSPEYLLRKVFRKDGPPLGVEFDGLPSHAFHLCEGKDTRISHRACQDYQRTLKRRKVSKNSSLEEHLGNSNSNSVKKHGIGKGLMTIWRLTNPGAVGPPTGVDFGRRAVPGFSASVLTKPPIQKKKKRPPPKRPAVRRPGKKVKDSKKLSARSRKVRGKKLENPKHLLQGNCKLALEEGSCDEDLRRFSTLVDDEELELREQQAGPNPRTCSAHLAASGLRVCSLCKDLLAKFPPNSVIMKQPLQVQPWNSSPDLVKKLFKVFHFLCTYGAIVGVFSFTLDEFAHAFNEKDSLLLGKIHFALLKLLLSDVELGMSGGASTHVSKNCKYRELLVSVEHQGSVLKLWKKSLNSLTWAEILCQILVAAGFGSKHVTAPREPSDKEVNHMAKFGLSPGTLKGELFTILLSGGNNGSTVSDLAKSSSVGELKLADSTDSLELLISSTLSSDITLFEKISSSTYRLRMNPALKEEENDQSDFEDFGSVYDDAKESSEGCSTDESEDGSRVANPNKPVQRDHCGSSNKWKIDAEIDESHPGEVWLLGLMEGEYSDLNVEEKLNALVALIDLVGAGSSIRKEDPLTVVTEYVANVNHVGSGAKVKRSSAKHQGTPWYYETNSVRMTCIDEASTRSVLEPVDSLISILKIQRKKSSNREKDAEKIELVDNSHHMQSIFLGSDRRYNRYWLFLGPCDMYDPGHKRIYFESSEDGHWEMIDTEVALCTLLSVLDRRGKREAQLLWSLEKRVAILCQSMSTPAKGDGVCNPTWSNASDGSISREDSFSAVSDVDNFVGPCEVQIGIPASTNSAVIQTGKNEQQKQKWSHIQAFDSWIWNSFYSDLNSVKYGKRPYLDTLSRCERCHDLYWRDEKHCKICHSTFELDFDLEERYVIHSATCRESSDGSTCPKHKVLPSQLQALKAAISAVESAMPEDAMLGPWKKSAHNLWVKRLRRTSTLVEFLQVLADFVGAINEEWICRCDSGIGSDSDLKDVIASFSAVAQTLSPVALWLVQLDDVIAPHLERIDLEKRRDLGTRSKGKPALRGRT